MKLTKKLLSVLLALVMMFSMLTVAIPSALAAESELALTTSNSVYTPDIASQYPQGYAAIVEGVKNFSSSIDVSFAKIPFNPSVSPNQQEMGWLFSAADDCNPELFYLSNSYNFTYGEDPETGRYIVYAFKPNYTFNAVEVASMQAQIDTAVNDIIKLTAFGQTDLEKLMIVHEEILRIADYSDPIPNLPDVAYTMYGILINGSGVCEGYTHTLNYILGKIGIETAYAPSKDMGHAWSMIKLDGQWYHCDLTWNDPTGSVAYGDFYHNYLLKSDSAFSQEIAFQAHSGWTNAPAANSSKYDNAFWNDVKSQIIPVDGYWYYSDGYELFKSKVSGEQRTSVYKSNTNWNYYADRTGYSLADGFMRTAWNGNTIYFNDNTNVYAYNTSTGETTTAYTTTESNQIFGIGIKDGKLYGDVKKGYTASQNIVTLLSSLPAVEYPTPAPSVTTTEAPTETTTVPPTEPATTATITTQAPTEHITIYLDTNNLPEWTRDGTKSGLYVWTYGSATWIAPTYVAGSNPPIFSYEVPAEYIGANALFGRIDPTKDFSEISSATWGTIVYNETIDTTIYADPEFSTFSFVSIHSLESWPDKLALDGYWREYRAPIVETTVEETTTTPVVTTTTPVITTTATITTQAPTEPVTPAEDITVYFENKYNWAPVALNYYGRTSGTITAEQTTDVGANGRVWKVTIPGDILSQIDFVLFRNNYDTNWGDYYHTDEIAPTDLYDGVCFYLDSEISPRSVNSYKYTPPASIPSTTAAPAPEVKYYIAGTTGLVGAKGWDPAGLEMTKINNNTYKVIFNNVAKNTYEYKVTNGAWLSIDTPNGNSWNDEGLANDLTPNAMVEVTADGATVEIIFHVYTSNISYCYCETIITLPEPTEPTEPATEPATEEPTEPITEAETTIATEEPTVPATQAPTTPNATTVPETYPEPVFGENSFFVYDQTYGSTSTTDGRWLFNDGCKLWVYNKDTGESLLLTTNLRGSDGHNSTYAYLENLPSSWKNIAIYRTRYSITELIAIEDGGTNVAAAGETPDYYNVWNNIKLQVGANCVVITESGVYQQKLFDPQTGIISAPLEKYFVAGNLELTGYDWDPAGLEMTKINNTTYKATFVNVPKGTYYYKVTNGAFMTLDSSYGFSWNEEGSSNEEGGNVVVVVPAGGATVEIIFHLSTYYKYTDSYCETIITIPEPTEPPTEPATEPTTAPVITEAPTEAPTEEPTTTPNSDSDVKTGDIIEYEYKIIVPDNFAIEDLDTRFIYDPAVVKPANASGITNANYPTANNSNASIYWVAPEYEPGVVYMNASKLYDPSFNSYGINAVLDYGYDEWGNYYEFVEPFQQEIVVIKIRMLAIADGDAGLDFVIRDMHAVEVDEDGETIKNVYGNTIKHEIFSDCAFNEDYKDMVYYPGNPKPSDLLVDPTEAPTEPVIAAKYYVAGDASLTGFDWNPAGLEMTRIDNYTYSLIIENLAKGTYYYKVTNGAWLTIENPTGYAWNQYGASNGEGGDVEVEITADGATVEIIFHVDMLDSIINSYCETIITLPEPTEPPTEPTTEEPTAPPTEPLNGIVEIDDTLYYYINGTTATYGLFKIDDDYYFSYWGGVIQTDGRYYVGTTYCDLPVGNYIFGADGKMLNGVVEVDGTLYLYINGDTTKNGLYKFGDDYYFTAWGGVILTNGTYYVDTTYCDLPAGEYTFGADGKLIAEPEPEPEITDFEYVVTNGIATITDYIGAGGDVTVPSTLGGYPVTTIGGWAFEDCTSLTSVTITNGVCEILSGAFENCTSLTSVTIPNSVRYIYAYVFYGCTALESVTLSDSITELYDETFYNCKSLKSITIPDGVTSIGYNAFYCCVSLESVSIPNSVTEIGFGAFENCRTLTSITIPNSITAIRDFMFMSCDSLTNITIPDSVTAIGNYAFGGCYSLTSITIPDSVATIGDYAFMGSALTSITISDSVISIGNYAFQYCDNLTISCYENSYAHTYAINNDIPYVLLDPEPEPEPETKTFYVVDKVAWALDNAADLWIHDNVSGEWYMGFKELPTNDARYAEFILDKTVSNISIYHVMGSYAGGPATGAEVEDALNETSIVYNKWENISIGSNNAYALTGNSTGELIANYDPNAPVDSLPLKLYFVKPNDWQSVYIYGWGATGLNGQFFECTDEGNGVYSFDFSPYTSAITPGVDIFKLVDSDLEWSAAMQTDNIAGEMGKNTLTIQTGYKGTWSYVDYDGNTDPTITLGDPTGDGEINIFDIMAIRDYIFGNSTLTGDAFTAADVNEDGETNVFDIMAIRNHIFGITLLV
ncbi:MAG: leucine-rich repeat protein [Oscillospiraceae bacterium]|jgi:hypothetical protein|nr:leucine-rich repeat protein [Oscillospiraceae bacterium]